MCALARSEISWWREAKATDALAAGVGVSRSNLKRGLASLKLSAETYRRESELAAEADSAIVTACDDDYPERLRELALPPPVLYVAGHLPERPALAVVGSRLASAYARDVTTGLAGELAGRGLVIVSGFARGVDTAAHRAAAEAPEGMTVAFLGCGIDVEYPRGRRRLTEAIVRRGAVASEFPCGTQPLPRNFPVRNRLISAFGDCGTLVVEATARSGSLITARLALELGRNVFAVPGRIFDDKARGPNTLIRDGAFPVQHPGDVLITLNQGQREALGEEQEGAAGPAPRLPPDLEAVWERIAPGERVGMETLLEESGLSAAEVNSALLELELGGWVRRHPGPAYSRSEIW